jgi:hypothetical protein
MKQDNGVYNSFFVQYNENGDVLLVSNVKDPAFSNFEISIDLIPNFITGKKDCRKYNIDYFFKIAEGLLTDDEEYSSLVKLDLLPYEIPNIINEIVDVLVEHDTLNKCWNIITPLYNREKLEVVSQIPLFVCKKNCPHILYAAYYPSADKLIAGAVTIPFQTDKELELNDVSVMTIKKFKSYGIKEKR